MTVKLVNYNQSVNIGDMVYMDEKIYSITEFNFDGSLEIIEKEISVDELSDIDFVKMPEVEECF